MGAGVGVRECEEENASICVHTCVFECVLPCVRGACVGAFVCVHRVFVGVHMYHVRVLPVYLSDCLSGDGGWVTLAGRWGCLWVVGEACGWGVWMQRVGRSLTAGRLHGASRRGESVGRCWFLGWCRLGT